VLYNAAMMLAWWHWVVFGVAVLVADIALVNVYFLLWFGIGAAGVGLCLLIWADMPAAAQVALWAVFSFGLLAAWLLVWRPKMTARETERLLREAGGEIVGMAGVIVRGGRGGGLIRFQRPLGGRDVWPFAGEGFKPGERAIVENIGGGGKLTIRREEEKSAAGDSGEKQ
jgi:membrane protein implicated in regulation of membrane protease activity